MIQIVGQVMGIVGVIFTLLSYQMKNDKSLLIAQSAATTFFCIHYCLLGAFSGLALNIVGIVRNLVYYQKNNPIFSSRLFPILFALVMGVMGVVSWQGWYSLLITVALMINTLCMASPSTQLIRKSILITSPLVLIYNCFVFSIGGVINESVAILSSVIGLIRYKREKA